MFYQWQIMISFWWCTNVLFDTFISQLDDLECGICLMFNAGISWQLWLGDNNFYHLQLNIFGFTVYIVQASSKWNHISYVSYLSVSCVIHLSLPYPDLGKVVHGCGRPIWSGWAGGAVELLTAPLSLSAAHSRLLSCSVFTRRKVKVWVMWSCSRLLAAAGLSLALP